VRSRGFTIIELVITLAIVGLMATAAMPLAQMVAKREKESELRTALRDIRTALDAYKLASDTGHIHKELGTSGYPPDLKSLYTGIEDAASPDPSNKKMLYFLRRVPRDPFFPDAKAAAEETWGLRSYASPPDDPQPGDDVYDVYSLDHGVGLNGVAYHDW
jgi:general secretion pathway protein G